MRDPELQSLLDKQDIREVLLKYCRAIDRCDEELLRTVYHPDARDEHGNFRGPASEFISYVMKGLKEGPYASTSHCLGNILIELDGDIAFAESYVTSWHPLTRDGDEYNWLMSGRYVDRFERRQGVWKIAHRVTVCDWEYLFAPPQAEVLERSGFMPRRDVFTTGKRSREDAVYLR
jgi:ketosteroid isomerase-like protein